MTGVRVLPESTFREEKKIRLGKHEQYLALEPQHSVEPDDQNTVKLTYLLDTIVLQLNGVTRCAC